MGKQQALTVVGFDYATVSKEAKGKLIYLAGQINREKMTAMDALMTMGQHIDEAHKLLAGDGRDGKFAEWIEDVCGVSRRTAYNYMHAYQRFSGCGARSHITQEAMYALSGPSVPPEAAKAAAKAAEKGERVDLKYAKNLLLKFDDDEPEPKPKEEAPAKAEPDAADLFSDALEHLRKITLLLDRINKLAKNDQLRREIFDSLDVANQDLIKWRKQARK